MPKIFLSHSHKDHRLVGRIHEFLKWASGGSFEIYRSSKDGAIKAGENWYEWIDKRILECDIAIVILTPSSFMNKWVMWEAGAVAGVQRERINKQSIEGNDRKVRSLIFDPGTTDLGPFAREQTVDGLNETRIAEFVQELLNDFKPEVKEDDYIAALRGLDHKSYEFVEGAKNDLRFSPFAISEGLVQEWLNRINEADKNNNYSWIVAAQRWINIAFLGAGNADDLLPIDFRIHSALALCHEQEKRWNKAIQQLELATSLSPNDLPILVRLGNALLSSNEDEKVKNLLNKIKVLDDRIFIDDREAIALNCKFFIQKNNWIAVSKLLDSASLELIAKDEYLSTWNALASMYLDKKEESIKRFRQLKKVTASRSGFWIYASRINAHLALNELDEAAELLIRIELMKKNPNEIESATRYYDEILNYYGRKFDWRSKAGLTAA